MDKKLGSMSYIFEIIGENTFKFVISCGYDEKISIIVFCSIEQFCSSQQVPGITGKLEWQIFVVILARLQKPF